MKPVTNSKIGAFDLTDITNFTEDFTLDRLSYQKLSSFNVGEFFSKDAEEVKHDGSDVTD